MFVQEESMQQYMAQVYNWHEGSLNKMVVSLKVQGQQNSLRITDYQEQDNINLQRICTSGRNFFDETFALVSKMEAI